MGVQDLLAVLIANIVSQSDGSLLLGGRNVALRQWIVVLSTLGAYQLGHEVLLECLVRPASSKLPPLLFIVEFCMGAAHICDTRLLKIAILVQLPFLVVEEHVRLDFLWG